MNENELKTTWLPLPMLAQMVGRTTDALRIDVRAGLLKPEKQPGIRSLLVRADKANAYIRRKHFGRVAPITAESLEQLGKGARP